MTRWNFQPYCQKLLEGKGLMFWHILQDGEGGWGECHHPILVSRLRSTSSSFLTKQAKGACVLTGIVMNVDLVGIESFCTSSTPSWDTNLKWLEMFKLNTSVGVKTMHDFAGAMIATRDMLFLCLCSGYHWKLFRVYRIQGLWNYVSRINLIAIPAPQQAAGEQFTNNYTVQAIL